MRREFVTRRHLLQWTLIKAKNCSPLFPRCASSAGEKLWQNFPVKRKRLHCAAIETLTQPCTKKRLSSVTRPRTAATPARTARPRTAGGVSPRGAVRASDPSEITPQMEKPERMTALNPEVKETWPERLIGVQGTFEEKEPRAGFTLSASLSLQGVSAN